MYGIFAYIGHEIDGKCRQIFQSDGSFGIYTLPRFNIAPEKGPFQEEGSLPIIIFEGTMLNDGGVNLFEKFRLEVFPQQKRCVVCNFLQKGS